MSVLVTGGTGFVGSWLVRKLAEHGEEVRVLHRASSSLADLDGVKFISCRGDVTDEASIEAAINGVDTVYHLAGVVGYSRAMRDAMEKVNIGGTRNVVSVLKRKSSIRLVYMSSVVAVGASFNRTPLNEESPYNIHSLNLGYFETKKAAEDLVVKACLNQEIQGVILNPSTVYGPGDAKKGSRKTQVKVAQGRLPFYTSGGVSVVSIHDVIDALLRARTKGRIGERYILSGDNITIRKLFHQIAELAGVRPPAIYLPNVVVHGLGKIGDTLEKFGKKGPLNSETAWTSTLYHWFDHSKAARELGFQPRPALEALKESVNWMKENGVLQ